MSEGHVREELGAYVLGALDPVDRRAVEGHVSGCELCRDELARLSGMPALLDRLSPDEAMSDLASVPAALGPQLAAGLASTADLLRARVRRWRLATLAASLTAVAIAATLALPLGQPMDDPLVVELRPIAADAGTVDATLAAYAWEWGTTVEIRASDLPERSRYVIVVIDRAGVRSTAGTWGPTAQGEAYVRSASAVPRQQLAAVEVRDDDDELLLGARLQDHDGVDPDW